MNPLQIAAPLGSQSSIAKQNASMTLYEYMCSKPLSNWFLRLTLLKIPTLESESKFLYLAKSISFGIFLLAAAAATLCFGYWYIYEGILFITVFNDLPLTWLFILTGFFTIVCCVFSYAITVHNYRKAWVQLRISLDQSDVPHIEPVVWMTLVFLAVTSSVIFIGFMLSDGVRVWPIAVMGFFANWFMSSGLMLSMLFIIVEARSCCGMVNALESLAEMQALTMDRYLATRDDIQKKVAYASSTLNSTFVVAIVNGIYFIFSTISIRVIVNTRASYNNSVVNYIRQDNLYRFYIGTVMVNCAVALKEILYLVLVLLDISILNDRANHLQVLLSQSLWSQNDNTRLQLYVSCAGKPISFYSLGLRLTRVQVYAQMLGYAFSILISVLQVVYNPIIGSAESASGA